MTRWLAALLLCTTLTVTQPDGSVQIWYQCCTGGYCTLTRVS